MVTAMLLEKARAPKHKAIILSLDISNQDEENGSSLMNLLS